jgi:hypothetical protein
MPIPMCWIAHDVRIGDYATWRGAGIKLEKPPAVPRSVRAITSERGRQIGQGRVDDPRLAGFASLDVALDVENQPALRIARVGASSSSTAKRSVFQTARVGSRKNPISPRSQRSGDRSNDELHTSSILRKASNQNGFLRCQFEALFESRWRNGEVVCRRMGAGRAVFQTPLGRK